MATMVNKENVLEVISQMTVMEVVELVKAMEDKFGVSAAVVAPVAAGAAVSAEAIVEEKTEFAVHLASIGAKKLDVIKIVRAEMPNLGLKEAKDLVESAPVAIKEGLPKAEAEELKKKLEAVGASVEIK